MQHSEDSEAVLCAEPCHCIVRGNESPPDVAYKPTSKPAILVLAELRAASIGY